MPQVLSRSVGQSRERVSFERASRGILAATPRNTELLVDSLKCPICLDVLNLPVSIICFPGCSGTVARGRWESFVFCMHCSVLEITTNLLGCLRWIDIGFAGRWRHPPCCDPMRLNTAILGFLVHIHAIIHAPCCRPPRSQPDLPACLTVPALRQRDAAADTAAG